MVVKVFSVELNQPLIFLMHVRNMCIIQLLEGTQFFKSSVGQIPPRDVLLTNTCVLLIS
jgi:hypothetical protein